MIELKNSTQLAHMQKGGKKLSKVLSRLLDEAQPGVELIALDDLAKKLIDEEGGSPSFMTVEDYKWATCLCVNDVVVHGIPTREKLKRGDVITIDVGMVYEGLHTDTAWTKIVSDGAQFQVDKQITRFVKTGETVLWKAIGAARPHRRVGDISREIQVGIEGAGYSVIKTLVGHGVGSQLHMEPQVPGVLRENVEKTAELVPGMTIAVEVIYALGSGAVMYLPDNWSIATKDGSLTAVYEHTIAITENGVHVLTDMLAADSEA